MTVRVTLDCRQHLGPVRDQGDRPTCLSHAASASHRHSRRGRADLSVEYLHYFGRQRSTGSGVPFAAIREALLADGQPEEACCPYMPRDPRPDWVPEATSVFRRQTAAGVASLASITSELHAGRLPVLGLSLPAGFFSPAAPWLIAPAGPILGLHAVIAVGLGTGPTGEAVLIRNSWGTLWADGGHAWLDRDFLAVHLCELMVLLDEAS